MPQEKITRMDITELNQEIAYQKTLSARIPESMTEAGLPLWSSGATISKGAAAGALDAYEQELCASASILKAIIDATIRVLELVRDKKIQGDQDMAASMASQ